MFIWKYYYSYSDVYLIKSVWIWQHKDTWSTSWRGTFVQLHKRALTWQKCLNYQSDIKRHGVDHPKNLMLNSKMFMHMLFVNYIMVFFFFPLAIEPPVAPCLNKSTFIRLDVFSSLPSLWNGMQHAVFARDVWYKSWSAWFCVRSPLSVYVWSETRISL